MPVKRKFFRRKRKLRTKVSKPVKRAISRAITARAPRKWQREYSSGYVVAQDSGSPYMVNLTDSISQGDTVNTREGDRINLSSLSMDYIASMVSTASGGTTTGVRVVLFKWLPDDAVETPTQAKLFEGYGITTNLTAIAPFNPDQADRTKFHVLKDWYFRQHSPVDGPTDTKRLRWTFNSKQLGIVRFNAGATTGRGHIYMYVYGTGTYSAGAGTDFSYLTGHSVIRFYDA